MTELGSRYQTGPGSECPQPRATCGAYRRSAGPAVVVAGADSGGAGSAGGSRGVDKYALLNAMREHGEQRAPQGVDICGAKRLGEEHFEAIDAGPQLGNGLSAEIGEGEYLAAAIRHTLLAHQQPIAGHALNQVGDR